MNFRMVLLVLPLILSGCGQSSPASPYMQAACRDIKDINLSNPGTTGPENIERLLSLLETNLELAKAADPAATIELNKFVIDLRTLVLKSQAYTQRLSGAYNSGLLQGALNGENSETVAGDVIGSLDSISNEYRTYAQGVIRGLQTNFESNCEKWIEIDE